ncbi:APC family permease [Planctomonas deserti]|uniref:APC family permease n=1 Tax=Planctomonas deserti TaxID=2144185 RepID=UPI00197C696C|nr:APC family permease [Planctomonas deserti]
MTLLTRRLGIGHAIGIGLASMIGAGAFYVWAPAAQAAGSGLFLGLLIAGIVATLNALSSAQLAMAHPVSGGAYAYGRATLGPWWGFAAGWLFLAGKTASAGGIALIAGTYLWPDQARVTAVLAILVFALVNITGIRSTGRVSVGIVTVVLSGIAGVVVVALLTHGNDFALPGWGWGSGDATAGGDAAGDAAGAGPFGVLQSAGLLFFAFAGYARMATLGEEVRDPRRTLPRAIVGALAIALVVYAVLGVLCVGILGIDGLARTAAPVAALVPEGWAPLVTVVAAVASLGSLMGILAGLSRTSLAMARGRDLPGRLGWIWPRTSAPAAAEATMAVLAILGVLLLDPVQLVGFSASSVLGYYAIAHLAARAQPPGERWLPRAVQYVGVVGCLVLSLTLPPQSVLAAALVLALGLALRAARLRARPTA